MPDAVNNFGGSLGLDFRMMTSRATQEFFSYLAQFSISFVDSLMPCNQGNNYIKLRENICFTWPGFQFFSKASLLNKIFESGKLKPSSVDYCN